MFRSPFLVEKEFASILWALWRILVIEQPAACNRSAGTNGFETIDADAAARYTESKGRKRLC